MDTKIKDHNGRLLIDYGSSHEMHLLKPLNNQVHICLYRPERWKANYHLIDILLKACVWIKAYEFHLKSGKSINEYVNTMK